MTLAPPAPRTRFMPWVIALVALALYAITLRGTYIGDDISIVRDDPRLHQPGQWISYFTTGYCELGVDHLYRPLTALAYKLQWVLHGDRPWAFHLVSELSKIRGRFAPSLTSSLYLPAKASFIA